MIAANLGHQRFPLLLRPHKSNCSKHLGVHSAAQSQECGTTAVEAEGLRTGTVQWMRNAKRERPGGNDHRHSVDANQSRERIIKGRPFQSRL